MSIRESASEQDVFNPGDPGYQDFALVQQVKREKAMARRRQAQVIAEQDLQREIDEAFYIQGQILDNRLRNAALRNVDATNNQLAEMQEMTEAGEFHPDTLEFARFLAESSKQIQAQRYLATMVAWDKRRNVRWFVGNRD